MEGVKEEGGVLGTNRVGGGRGVGRKCLGAGCMMQKWKWGGRFPCVRGSHQLAEGWDERRRERWWMAGWLGTEEGDLQGGEEWLCN